MRWAALRTKTKATIVVAVAATIWLGGVGSAGALVGAVASNAADARPMTAVAAAETARPEVTRTPTPTPTPVVAVSEETEDTAIPFERTSVDDPALPKGQSKVTTPGIDGVETTTWRVTTTDGVETDRVEVGKEVTKTPVAEVTAIGSYVAPAAPAPAPVQQAPAAPAPVQQAPVQDMIIPGAFCSGAQSGTVAQAANGRSYQCGGKGPDASGHLHWNAM